MKSSVPLFAPCQVNFGDISVDVNHVVTGTNSALYANMCYPPAYTPYLGHEYHQGKPYRIMNDLYSDRLEYKVFVWHSAPYNLFYNDVTGDYGDCFWYSRNIPETYSDISCENWCFYNIVENARIEPSGDDPVLPNYYFTCTWDVLSKICTVVFHSVTNPCHILVDETIAKDMLTSVISVMNETSTEVSCYDTDVLCFDELWDTGKCELLKGARCSTFIDKDMHPFCKTDWTPDGCFQQYSYKPDGSGETQICN